MIAECLLIKNENRYLLEHLASNAAAGVEHFFIYDNLSDTPDVISLMKWQEVTMQTKQSTPPII